MFGWLFKKSPTPASSESEPADVPIGTSSAPAETAAPTVAPPPPKPSSGSVPAPPPLDIPAPPPVMGGEDWGAMLDEAAPPAPPPKSSPSSGKVDTSSAGLGKAPAAPAPVSNPGDTPDLLVPGVQLRAIPEKQPATPRGWNVRVLKIDSEGIWLTRVQVDEDPLPVSPRELLTLVIFDERKQVSYDCPVIRIKPGNPEQVLVGRPLKSTQEKSKLDSIGGRQHYRIETQLPVEVKIPVAGGKSATAISGHTRDISKGGLCLMLPRGFDQGRELDIRVLSWNFPLQVRAKVVRCDEAPGGRFSVAVSFPEDMGAITRDLIGHFIMENQRGRT